VVLIFVIANVVSAGLFLFAIHYSQFTRFLQSSVGSALVSIAGLILLLAIALWVAKIRKIDEFKSAFALVRPSEKELLVSIGLGIFLQYAGIFLSS